MSVKCASLFSGGIFRHNDQVSGGDGTNSAQLNYSFSARNYQIALNFLVWRHIHSMNVKPDNNCEWQIYRKWVIKWLQYVPCPVLQSLRLFVSLISFQKMKNKQQLCSSLTLQWGGRFFRSFSREWHKRNRERVKRGGIINDLHYKMIWSEFKGGHGKQQQQQTYLFFFGNFSDLVK